MEKTKVILLGFWWHGFKVVTLIRSEKMLRRKTISAPLCIGMCTDMCTDVYMYICIDTIYVCIDMWIAMCINMCIDMHTARRGRVALVQASYAADFQIFAA